MSTVISINGGLYFLHSKASLKDKVIQSALSEAHKSKDKECKCLCNENSQHPLLYDIRCRNKLYFIAKNSAHSKGHSEDCLYHDENGKYEDDNGCYSASIFEEVLTSEPSRSQLISRLEADNKSKRNTFKKLCERLISSTVIYTLHVENDKDTRREHLSNITANKFLGLLDNKIKKATEFMSNKKSIQANIPKGSQLIYGFLKESVFAEEQQNETVIELPVVVNYNSVVTTTKGYRIGASRFNITRKSLVNYGNITNPPYFYIAIANASAEIIRMFVYPVCLTNGHLAFVESELERQYAKRLIETQQPFIKPITNQELWNLRSLLLKRGNEDNPKRPNLAYRPDFILFKKDSIDIVEVSGYDSVDYQQSLARKREWYSAVIEKPPFKGFYNYYETATGKLD